MTPCANCTPVDFRLVHACRRPAGRFEPAPNLRTTHLEWTAQTYRIHGFTPEAFVPSVETAIGFSTPCTRPLIRQAVETAIAVGARLMGAKLRIAANHRGGTRGCANGTCGCLHDTQVFSVSRFGDNCVRTPSAIP